MRRFWVLSGSILFVLLLSFVLFEDQFPNPETFMNNPTISVALFGIVLLVGDLFLPVPSSLVMIANGAIFGVFLGTTLSLIGGTGAALLGFYLGKRGFSRLLSKQEIDQAQEMFARSGTIALILTRPIPLLSETVPVVAGMSQMPLQRVLVAVLVGGLPTAVLYAITGTLATTFNSGVWSFLFVIGVAGLFWFIQRRFFYTQEEPQ